jgi:hypothetical protein
LTPWLSADQPFPGLRPFEYEDRAFFFGRDEQIFALYRLTDRSRFSAVIGSSGSGKSSLVRAGLLPLLDEESQGQGGKNWRSATMRPGDDPIGALADALAELAPRRDGEDEAIGKIRRDRIEFALRKSSFGLADAIEAIPGLKDKSLLLVVDQFEELFRYAAPSASSDGSRASSARWRAEAGNFVQLLLQGTRDRAHDVHVLITMRSDFIGDCAQFQGLPEAVSASQFLVPGLTRDQREDVIRRPIAEAGATIEPVLVERLLNDGGSELDQLPVLQHCLSRLWDRAGRARRLSLEDYEAIGTVRHALSQHADEVMATLPGLELTVEQVFRALSERDKEGRATRRALPYAQLLAETGVTERDLRTVIERFRAEDCSFLTPRKSTRRTLDGETRIDVVHEALLRRWDRMAEGGWLAEEESDGQLYRALLALLGAA